MIVLNDEEIVRLYYERSEDGIAQSEQKYGRLCRSVIRRILPDERDAEECLSDVWIRTWNSIPPEKPRVLGAFLARIARNLALDKLSYNGAGKRASALTEAFEELEPCLVGADDMRKSCPSTQYFSGGTVGKTRAPSTESTSPSTVSAIQHEGRAIQPKRVRSKPSVPDISDAPT